MQYYKIVILSLRGGVNHPTSTLNEGHHEKMHSFAVTEQANIGDAASQKKGR